MNETKFISYLLVESDLNRLFFKTVVKDLKKREKVMEINKIKATVRSEFLRIEKRHDYCIRIFCLVLIL